MPDDNPTRKLALEPAEEYRLDAVECLGMTFRSDDERREYFIRELEQRLTTLRQRSDFPIGEDEDILRLSDPPYYTACPNPFLQDFVERYGRSYNPDELYRREPFAVDVTEGRHTWLYKAHTYHTKVPPKAIRQFVEHFTDAGDIVLDAFAGSGMTALACMMAAQPRTALCCDLSPAASFIASTYGTNIAFDDVESLAEHIIERLDEELGWMYSVGNESPAAYYVWSDILICVACHQEMTFWDTAFDDATGDYKKVFPCPRCGAINSKATSLKAEHTTFDPLLGRSWKRYKQVPVLAAIPVGNSRRLRRRRVNSEDRRRISEVEEHELPEMARRLAVPMMFREGQWGDQWKNCLHLRPITHAHQFFTRRQLHYVARFLELIDLDQPAHRALLFSATSVLQKVSRLMVYNADGIGRVQKGTLYISSVFQEMRFTHMLAIAVKDMRRAVKEGMWDTLPSTQRSQGCATVVWTGSCAKLPIPANSIDYAFIDPPFGANIPYTEVNFLWETLLSVFTRPQEEAVVSGIQNKVLSDYQSIMSACLREIGRVLKPGRWTTVEFHNSRNSVWNAIQEALQTAGLVVGDIRVLDKKQKSFKQATTAGAVRKDLVISAYKPNDGLEQRFALEAGTEEGVWAFVRTHMRQVSVFVARDLQVEVVAERQSYLLFDRMLAFHVQRGVTVPVSAAEFYEGLAQRFPERDGMYFLPDQVAEYDRKRTTVSEVAQLDLFVRDEETAIQWLRQRLVRNPQTLQDLHSEFVRELVGWEKHECAMDLADLLVQNFLCYSGAGEVPSQIHGYLSSNYKELRGLGKEDRELRLRAKDRWYVPDPRNAGDLEKLREQMLLREFGEYVAAAPRKLKVFRTEAVRSGFRRAWQLRDYDTIIGVAHRIPANVLREDSKLLMWFDQAVTRTGE